MNNFIIGVDVSKHRYDCFDMTSGRAYVVAPQTLEPWLKSLRARTETLVVFEATGIYGKRLGRALSAAGIAIAEVNPRQVRRYAQACGELAKNDRIDAQVIAHYAVACGVQSKIASQDTDALRILVTRRDQLLAMIQAERGHLETSDDPATIEAIDEHLALLIGMRKQIETRIKKTLERDPRAPILISMPGIGSTVAASLLAHLPEIGSLKRGEAAALAGVAPYVRDSGTFKGRRVIYGGRAPVRKALYMAALVAIRRNPVYAQAYAGLIMRGKAFKVAITAIMRRMLETLNLMCKHNDAWKIT